MAAVCFAALTHRDARLNHLLDGAGIPFTRGNAVDVYRLGSAGLDAMLAAIQGAKHWVDLETYILRADETGRRFLAALAERARAGVEIRLQYDDFGARGVGARVLRPLREAGVEVAVFNPLLRSSPGERRQRDHRKILVIDGEVAFTGGLNVANECHDGTRHRGRSLAAWRDLHLRIAGPAVDQLETVFLESWSVAKGAGIQRRARAEPSVPCGDQVLAILPDGPRRNTARLHDLLCAALEATERDALFVTPYFLPGARMRSAMTAAAERGVRLEVLVAGYNDHPMVARAVRSLLPSFVQRGVEVFEYEGALMHAKAAIFDGTWAIVGTSNLDQQSFFHAYEVNVIARGGTLPGVLADIVREDLKGARRVTSESLARRPTLARLRDRAAAAVVRRL